MIKGTSRRKLILVACTPALAGCTSSGNRPSTQIPDNDRDNDLAPLQQGWPMERRDAANTGYSETDSGSEPESLNWVYSGDDGIYTEPVLADNRLFYKDVSGRTNALNAQTGEILWAKDDGMAFTPLAADTHCAYFQANDGLLARDSETGEIVWEREPTPETHAGPVLFNDSLYFGDSFEGILSKYDVEDGSKVWETDLSGPSGRLSADNSCVVAIAGDSIERINHSGDRIWQQSVGAQPIAHSIYEDLILVTTDDGVLVALEKEDGTSQWQYDTGSSTIISHPTSVADRIFVIDRDGVIHAVSSAGDSLWTWDTSTDDQEWRGDLFRYGITATNNWIYALGFDDHIHVLDPTTGSATLESRWEGDIISCPPIIVDDVSFIIGTATNVRAVSLS